MFEKIQRRVTKPIPGLRRNIEGMCSNNTGDANIEVFKISNGQENIEPNIFFQVKTGKKNN